MKVSLFGLYKVYYYDYNFTYGIDLVEQGLSNIVGKLLMAYFGKLGKFFNFLAIGRSNLVQFMFELHLRINLLLVVLARHVWMTVGRNWLFELLVYHHLGFVLVVLYFLF